LLNQIHVQTGQFAAVTQDVTQLNYTGALQTPNIVINTSCEHLGDFSTWLQAMPAQTLLVLQSNDYFSCDEHVNCVADLQAFKSQADLGSVLYAGKLERKRYNRFMLIGRR